MRQGKVKDTWTPRRIRLLSPVLLVYYRVHSGDLPGFLVDEGSHGQDIIQLVGLRNSLSGQDVTILLTERQARGNFRSFRTVLWECTRPPELRGPCRLCAGALA